MDNPPRAAASARFPAAYNYEVLATMRTMVPPLACRILDPFAGPTGIRRLRDALGTECASGERKYLGVEIEPEWADEDPDTIVGDAASLTSNAAVRAFTPSMVITSPPYGNRMADQYMGDPKGSVRHTYAIALGRKLSEGSAAAAQWGPRYQTLMSEAYREIYQILPYGGFFLLNIANHYRRGVLQLVVPWSVERIVQRDMVLRHWKTVKTPKQRHGANGDLREEFEQLFLFEKVEP